MKNLKRLLSLALAGTILSGMMVMGASAADFTDADEIVNTEAVDTMVALNIINGKDTGAFDPEGLVTRAEMAKMIATAVNGGVAPTFGVKATPTYTDTKGHWAEQFIEYCSDMKYINGRGNGTFDPNGNVTGVEAAKMVLTALGYESRAYQLTGADWAINTNALAIRNCKPSLYENLNGVSMNQPISRDTAAQLIWNGVQNNIVEYNPNVTITGTDISYGYTKNEDVTLLKQAYDANVSTGMFEGNSKTDDGLKDGQIKVDVDTFNGVVKTDGAASTNYGSKTITAELDIDFIGENVKVIWKDEKNTTKGLDSKDKIYGVFPTGETEVVRATRGLIGNNKVANETKIKVDGTKYDLDTTVTVHWNHASTQDYEGTNTAAQLGDGKTYGLACTTDDNSSLTNDLKVANGDAIKMILKDGKVTDIYVTETKLAKVSAKNSEKITLTNGFGSVKIADNDIYEGVAKDDIVVVTRLYNTAADKGYTIVKKAEVVSGTVEGYKNTESVTLDGETYNIFEGTAKMLGVKDTAIEKFANNSIGEEFDLYLVNGYVAAAVQTSESNSNYSLVIDVSEKATAGSVLNGLKIQVLGSDGAKTVLTLSSDSVDKTKTPGKDGKYPAIADQSGIKEGDIVTYSVDKNGEATVEKVGAVKSDNKKASYASKTKSFDGTTISSECVLYANIAETGTDYKAYDLRSLGDFDVDANAGLTVVPGDNDEIVAVFANLGEKPSGATTTTVYGIVSKDRGVVKVDGTAYGRYTVDVNDEQHTVYTNVALSEGDLVEMDLTSDNIYTASELDVIDETDLGANDIVGYVSKYSERDNTVSVVTAVKKVDDSDEYVADGTAKVFAIDGDTKVYYVDKNNKAGVVGSITEFDVLKHTKNIIVFGAADKTADVIIFEVSNEKDILGTTTPAPAEKVTIGAITAPTTKDGAVYSVTAGAGEVTVGEEFTVTINCTTAPTNTTDGEVVTITYNGTEETLTFKATGEQSVKFTAAKDVTDVTAEVK